ncbi:E3 ubiquitin-protein ligase XIAP-like [Biomphalaria glabrata]|uniref:E3 ubiquitin-protein ligase XIAP-like n=2 Tax=Biomphalaria glabrata TaxID=6526 RepID=A0A9W3A4U0_BIOGL|nr:E3 ubiquitin-protein ligase XIAP-like [Biomphalaria glabrata]
MPESLCPRQNICFNSRVGFKKCIKISSDNKAKKMHKCRLETFQKKLISNHEMFQIGTYQRTRPSRLEKYNIRTCQGKLPRRHEKRRKKCLLRPKSLQQNETDFLLYRTIQSGSKEITAGSSSTLEKKKDDLARKDIYCSTRNKTPSCDSQNSTVLQIFSLQHVHHNMVHGPQVSNGSLRVNFNYEIVRLRTYHVYPKCAFQFALLLARDGFVYIGTGSDDAVMCYICHVIKSEWTESEDVTSVHKRMSPVCPMANATECGNIPIAAGSNTVDEILAILADADYNKYPAQSTAYSDDSRYSDVKQTTDMDVNKDIPSSSCLYATSNASFSENPTLSSHCPQSQVNKTETLSSLPKDVCPLCPAQTIKKGRQLTRVPSTSENLRSSPQAHGVTRREPRHERCETRNHNTEMYDRSGSTKRRTISANCIHLMSFQSETALKGYINDRRQVTQGEQAQLQEHVLQSRRSYSELGIQTGRPKFPQYTTKESRAKTFTNWPDISYADKKHLIDAGFYFTGEGKTVCCFFCGGALGERRKREHPWIEHAKAFPQCGYLQLRMGSDFINEVQSSNTTADTSSLASVSSYFDEPDSLLNEPSVRVLLDHGLDESLTLRAASRVKSLGGMLSSDAIKETMEELCHQEEETTATVSPQDLEEIKQLRKASSSLRQLVICKLCKNSDVQVAFLPCGHLVSCVECSLNPSYCPECRSEIIGIRRIFITGKSTNRQGRI